MATNTDDKPSAGTANLVRVALLVYSLVAGYYAATRPNGAWRSPFSWHPFLMTVGMVGCMGIAAVTRKMRGYTNVKIHGMVANLGVVLSLGGLYAIYHNKNLNGSAHFTSPHGMAGLACVACSIGAGMVGGLFLHPDFGMDKTNQTIRMAHRTFARLIMASAWFAAFVGFTTMTQDPMELVLFGAPLVGFASYVIV